MKELFKSSDLRTDNICANCAKRGQCIYARTTKAICNNFVVDKEED